MRTVRSYWIRHSRPDYVDRPLAATRAMALPFRANRGSAMAFSVRRFRKFLAGTPYRVENIRSIGYGMVAPRQNGVDPRFCSDCDLLLRPRRWSGVELAVALFNSRFRDDLRASARSTPARCAYQSGVRRTCRWRKSDSNRRYCVNTTKVSRPPHVASAWFPATRNTPREPEAIPAMEPGAFRGTNSSNPASSAESSSELRSRWRPRRRPRSA